MGVILSPVITEKSINEATKGRFTFKVTMNATKEQVKKEVSEKFKVDVTSVSSIVVKGKMIRSGQKRLQKQTSVYKKAIVSLKEGQKIGLFDTGGQS